MWPFLTWLVKLGWVFFGFDLMMIYFSINVFYDDYETPTYCRLKFHETDPLQKNRILWIRIRLTF